MLPEMVILIVVYLWAGFSLFMLGYEQGEFDGETNGNKVDMFILLVLFWWLFSLVYAILRIVEWWGES